MQTLSRVSLVLALLLSACANHPALRNAALITGAVLIAGQQQQHHDSSDPVGHIATPGNPCQTNPQACR